MNKKWYVITGGPSSGISATTLYLATYGYHTLPETARVVIETDLARGKKLERIRQDEKEFQDRVLELGQRIEAVIPRDRTVIFQRGLPDAVAYYKYIGADAKEIEDICKQSAYGKVFILEPLPFKQDHARTEGEEGSRRIFELLKETYKEMGLNVVIIPKTTIEARAKMILNHIKRNQNDMVTY